MKFVERKDVFDIFQDEIAQVTDETIAARVGNRGWNPETIYVAQRKHILREIILEIVKYAMFSHRWDAAGEPNNRDVTTGKQRNTAGFKKLTNFCKTAKSLGYKLAWSDTCCIDKSNTAELSEAIHAMFKWYSHSYLCIIHLAESSSYSDFDHEPWFTRGWTLQELLAPRRVKFYTKKWEPLTTHATINDKEDKYLLSALSTVTGIPETAIAADNSKGIKRRSVWEIMSWASKRKTTRVEDIAYSLIGLFGVNLTITYGEGEKAFPRLVEAIMMSKPKWDVFAW
ncbi:heterokaryon incompatibility protein-domain-containing protein, partial [Melanogaster broomeanus]